MSTPKGRHVWFDLMTGDVEAAKAFYTEVIGWGTQGWEGGDYTMWVAGEQPIGGLMKMPEEAKGAPPHWLGYVAVEDLDATVAKVEELGGKVHRGATDIPSVGRFAILADPQGAVFAGFQSSGDMEPVSRDQHGAMSWAELNTTDYESAWDFYSRLLGWEKTGDWDMGQGAGKYLMFKDPASEGSRGGMSNVAKQQSLPAHWLYYTTVDDMDAAVERVKSHGGKILNGPMEIPGEVESRICQCMDPEGAPFALYWESRS